VPVPSAALDRVAAFLCSPQERADGSRTLLSESKRLAGFALPRHVRLAHRKPRISGDFRIGHLVKAANRHIQFLRDASQLTHQFFIRPAEDQRVRLGLVAQGRDLGEVAGGNHDRAPVFDDERMGIARRPPKRFHLGTSLAGAEDQGNALAAQRLQCSGRSCP